MLGITTTNARVGGFRGGISAEAKTIYNRIIADGGVSNLTRLNFFVKGLKAIYGDLANVPVCYDAHWIGYKLGSGTGATAGQAAAKLYSLTVAGDAVQSTAASQPLLLAHNGDNYWWGSGVSGNYCSTPHAVNNQLTGDFSLEVKINTKSSTTNQQIVGKYNGGGGGQGTFFLRFSSTNFIQLWLMQGGSDINYTSTSAWPYATNTDSYIRVSRNTTNGEIKIYTSLDGITYTQLGTTLAGVTGALNNNALDMLVGASIGGNSYPFTGNIYYVKIYKDLTFTTPTQTFNPATYNAATSQTAWTSSTGEVWTINTGTATTGYKGVLVDRSIVMYDRTDDSLLASNNATLNTVLGTDHCSVLVATRYSTTNTEFLIQVGGDFPNANATQWWGTSSPNFYRSNNGSVVKSQLTLNTYTIAKAFSYADSIIFGGTSVQVINASSESGSFFNNTTNKPIPNTGLLLGRSAGIGSFNGIISTIIIGNDPTKYLLTKELARSLNNNFAL